MAVDRQATFKGEPSKAERGKIIWENPHTIYPFVKRFTEHYSNDIFSHIVYLHTSLIYFLKLGRNELVRRTAGRRPGTT